MSSFLKFAKNLKTTGVTVTHIASTRRIGTKTNFVMMAASDTTFEKIKSGVVAASEYTFEKTKAGVIAASDYTCEKTKAGVIAASNYTVGMTKAGAVAASDFTIEKTKEGLAYAQEISQPTVDSVMHSVHDGLKTISNKFDNAADSFEKKDGVTPVWEGTKANVIAATNYTVEKTKEGLAYAQEISQPTVDAAKHNVQEGLKSMSINIDAAVDSAEKQEPSAPVSPHTWEQTKVEVYADIEAARQVALENAHQNNTAESNTNQNDPNTPWHTPGYK